MARYIRNNDPYKRLLTLHPQAMRSCRDQIDDPSLLDFELLQTNHDDWWGTPSSLGLLVSELEKTPRMPVMIRGRRMKVCSNTTGRKWSGSDSGVQS